MERSIHFQSNGSFVCLFHLGFRHKGLSFIPITYIKVCREIPNLVPKRQNILNSNGFIFPLDMFVDDMLYLHHCVPRGEGNICM